MAEQQADYLTEAKVPATMKCSYPPCVAAATEKGLCKEHIEQANFFLWLLPRVQPKQATTGLVVPEARPTPRRIERLR